MRVKARPPLNLRFLKSLTTFLRKSLYNAANIWYYLSTYRGAATMSMRN